MTSQRMASHVIPRSNACHACSTSETQRNPVFRVDMAAEGTMPGGLVGPRRAPSPQRGAAPPLQHLGKIPESQKTWDPPWDTALSLLSIQALKRAQQDKAERLA